MSINWSCYNINIHYYAVKCRVVIQFDMHQQHVVFDNSRAACPIVSLRGPTYEPPADRDVLEVT